MQRIYNCVPETNHVSTVYSVAATLYTISATCNVISCGTVFCTYTLALCDARAVPSISVFCGSFISCSLGMLLRYCLSDSEMVPVAPIITDITFASTFHMRSNSFGRSLYFRIFSAYHISVSRNCNIYLTCEFLFYYHGLWCPVCCWE